MICCLSKDAIEGTIGRLRAQFPVKKEAPETYKMIASLEEKLARLQTVTVKSQSHKGCCSNE
jgi:hypothetical protein